MPDVDLNNCDREPIHIPGTIQSHGCLVSSDSQLRNVLRCSANFEDMTGILLDRPVSGTPLEDLFGSENTHAFRNAIAASNASGRPSLLFDIPVGKGSYDVSVHHGEGEAILEFEPVQAGRSQPLDIVRTLMAKSSEADTVEDLVRRAARLIRASLGYDRVMVYRFEEDGAGQIVSEARASHLESFMGQYFPASDIPKQARILYLRNTIRIIADASGKRIPILPELDGEGRPLDLSLSHLRSVSPIHCEYLRNMGVAASMSISIIIDGGLWGLIACHHYSPKFLNMAERAAIEMFGEVFSLRLDLIREKRRIHAQKMARRSLDQFLEAAPRHRNIFDLLRDSLSTFMAMIPSDGLGLWIDGNWSGTGSIATFEYVSQLVPELGATGEGKLWATHNLKAEFPHLPEPGNEVSGLLVVPLSQRPRDYLIFFRKEFEHTLNWGGDPNKSYTSGPLGDRLTPRKSFDIWKQTVRHQSRRWTEQDLEAAEAIRSSLVEIVLRHNEILVEERGKADLRQRMLNEELNHRVKNILAVIKSLVGQGQTSEKTVEEYLAALRGRIEALSIAHDQIVRGDGGGFLKALLKAELRPYGEQSSRIVLDGPVIWVDTAGFSVLALVFHELATNSVKYGSLSSATGRLEIRWHVTPDGDCEIRWTETGGPTVRPPSRKGFGSILIQRSIPHDLGGKSRIFYEPEGLRALFSIPEKHIAIAENIGTATPDETASMVDRKRKGLSMSDIRVLLVEDQMLIAMDAEMMLTGAGMTQINTVGSVNEAMKAIPAFRPMVAVLDVNLGADTSIPIARELRKNAVPFLFATGYGDGAMIPSEFSDVRVVRKPYSSEELVPVLLDLVDR